MHYILAKRASQDGSLEAIVEQTRTGIKGFRNGEALPDPEGGFIFRWGCTGNVPHSGKVINKAKAIHTVFDKAGFRRLLWEQGLAPEVWTRLEQVQFPAVVRATPHEEGSDFYVVRDEAGLRAALVTMTGTGRNWYAAPLIPKTREFRVYVVSGRVVQLAEKFPPRNRPDVVCWSGVYAGGYVNVRWGSWPLDVVGMGVEAVALAGLDFGGADVILAERPWVLEVNSAPSLTLPYEQECFIGGLDWIVEHGRGVMQAGGDNWRDWVHPSRSGDARGWRR